VRTVDVTTLARLGYGSFFMTFRLSKTRVIKVPSLYDSWPTEEMRSILLEQDLSEKDWLVFDALRGSLLPGALPVLTVALAKYNASVQLSLVMPYATKASLGEIRAFVEEHPHWAFDAHPDNYGKWKGKTYRIDTQTKTADALFIWV
jgi:hypothetical protein